MQISKHIFISLGILSLLCNTSIAQDVTYTANSQNGGATASQSAGNNIASLNGGSGSQVSGDVPLSLTLPASIAVTVHDQSGAHSNHPFFMNHTGISVLSLAYDHTKDSIYPDLSKRRFGVFGQIYSTVTGNINIHSSVTNFINQDNAAINIHSAVQTGLTPQYSNGNNLLEVYNLGTGSYVQDRTGATLSIPHANFNAQNVTWFATMTWFRTTGINSKPNGKYV